MTYLGQGRGGAQGYLRIEEWPTDNHDVGLTKGNALREH